MPMRQRTCSLPATSIHSGLSSMHIKSNRSSIVSLDQNLNEYKLCAIGMRNVGKSVLTRCYTTGKIGQDNNAELLNNFHQGTVFRTVDVIDGIQSSLYVLDTIGNDFCNKISSDYLRSMDGFVVIYSVTDQLSFQIARELVEQIVTRKRRRSSQKKSKSQSLPLVIVANKTDLVSQRVVSKKEGEELAWEFGCSFYECAATLEKHTPRVRSIFHDLINQVRCVERESKPSNDSGTLVRAMQKLSAFKKRNKSSSCLELKEKGQQRQRLHSIASSI